MANTEIASTATEARLGAENDEPTSPSLLARLQEVVSNAARRIELFRQLYGENCSIQDLGAFQSLPTTSQSDYVRLDDVIDSCKELWDNVALSPWDWEHSRLPISVLLDKQAESAFQERAEFLLKEMNASRDHPVTLLVDGNRIYPAADVADVLIYLGYASQLLMIDNLSELHIHAQLRDLAPCSLMLFTDRKVSRKVVPNSVRCVVSFNQKHNLRGPFRRLDVYHLDEIPLIAVANSNGPYRSRAGHFFFEQNGADALLITTLKQDLMPFIRYDTGTRVRLVSRIPVPSFRR